MVMGDGVICASHNISFATLDLVSGHINLVDRLGPLSARSCRSSADGQGPLGVPSRLYPLGITNA